MDAFSKKYDSIKKKLILEYADAKTQKQRLREECYSLGFLWQTLENDERNGYWLGKYWKMYGLVSCRIYCEYKNIDGFRRKRTFWIALGNKLDDLEYSTPDFGSGPDDIHGITPALDNILADTDIETNEELREFRDEVVRMAKEKGLEEDVDADIAAAFSDLKSIHI